MLNKLLKNELKATARLLVPLYLILLVFTLMDRLVLSLDIFKGVLAIIPGFITFFYVLSNIAIVTVTFVIIIMRFYKNLLSEEGYLMFTLPVSARQLINSKLLVSIFWTVASILAVLASVFLAFAKPDTMHDFLEGFRIGMAELNKAFGGFSALLIFEFVFMIILSLVNGILMIYTSIAVGQLFNGHKLLGAFLAYMGINTVIQILSAIVLFLASRVFETTLTDINSLPQLVLPITIVLLLGLNVVYYVVTDYMFKKKLNLE